MHYEPLNSNCALKMRVRYGFSIVLLLTLFAQSKFAYAGDVCDGSQCGCCYRPQTKFGERSCFFTCVSFCSQGGGLPGGGECLPPGGSAFGGVCIDWGLGRPPSTTGYGQQAGGTHPTGMHPCFEMLCDFVL